jgi:nitrite reductase/ring-hydroxylating ferredoxin subunit
MELDWNQGEFFESSGLFLMCATHGALYEPDTGKCAGGPCRGGSLKQITVIEKEHKIFWQPDDVFRPVLA